MMYLLAHISLAAVPVLAYPVATESALSQTVLIERALTSSKRGDPVGAPLQLLHGLVVSALS